MQHSGVLERNVEIIASRLHEYGSLIDNNSARKTETISARRQDAKDINGRGTIISFRSWDSHTLALETYLEECTCNLLLIFSSIVLASGITTKILATLLTTKSGSGTAPSQYNHKLTGSIHRRHSR